MRQSLLDLIEKTIVYQYDLPNSSIGIAKTIVSVDNDQCFKSIDKNDFTEIIYNSILEYSFNEFDIENKDYDKLHYIALQNRLKFNPDLDLDQKIKYGFLGEVILFSVLYVLFKSQPLIARGYFYNPLENSETKGYDSYHLIENKNQTELWFGEVKFHKNYKTGIKSIFKNIDKAISDNYLQTNVFAISNQINNLHCKGSKIEKVIKDWEENPYLSIIDEMKQHNMKLVYPVMLLYEEDDLGFDESIKNIPKYIQEEFATSTFNISVDYSIFFILVPMKDVKTIKEEVIKWIELRKPLMS
ncbi:Hachiman antiphage defense system protein HamA [Flavobacterium sp. ZE23DGlu08]|uniref:Hachiman antiphage defense system protein HamA n=1 Tax=Flavobacterium sp. ZE23DGlu08 TaxID=3059026 RepID=UPI00265F597F|nr:Hachiman antiphage defense system protein HamA [Flavobacterium sp. ZE23DGlu08]WKL43312.1 SAVED domain-containing protein [Flavobacterium sp. ZE23DGlu08]